LNLLEATSLKLITRNSPLALWQAEWVQHQLQAAGLSVEIIGIETTGDKRLEVTLSKIGDKGVFTQELEARLLTGEVHLAVHSAKDMPSRLPEGLEIIAFTEREEPMDVLVSPDPEVRLSNVSVLGTSSTRRVATLARYFDQIKTVSVRGNLQTRIRKMQEGACEGLILAYAGVHRMGFSELIRERLPMSVFTPAVGQGSLAIEVASRLDPVLKEKIKSALNHSPTELCLLAERAFLRQMDGGCSIPVFGYAQFTDEGKLTIQGGIISLDGLNEVRESIHKPCSTVDQALQIGRELANHILDKGGKEILQKIKQHLQP
jgi:hydroxymethylbilane synthase